MTLESSNILSGVMWGPGIILKSRNPISAMDSRPGVTFKISVPVIEGTLAPVISSFVIAIVPPVKTIIIFFMGPPKDLYLLRY